MRWAVYYADGTRVTDREESVWTVPTRGVICLAQPDDRAGRLILNRHDFYWWVGDGEGWYGGDIFGLWDYLCSPGRKRVLFGRSAPHTAYEGAMERARTDDYLPEQSAVNARREN